jgi:hypothetical protein
LEYQRLARELSQRGTVPAKSVLKPSVYVSTMVDNVPAVVADRSIWEISVKIIACAIC